MNFGLLGVLSLFPGVSFSGGGHGELAEVLLPRLERTRWWRGSANSSRGRREEEGGEKSVAVGVVAATGVGANAGEKSEREIAGVLFFGSLAIE